jgi:hypothetical protein
MVSMFEKPNARAHQNMVAIRSLWRSIQRAKDMVRDNTAPHGLAEIIKTICWEDHPLVRYLMDMCEEAGWQFSDGKLRDFVWKLFTGETNTLHTCEKVFGALSIAQGDNASGSISDVRVYQIAATAGALNNATSQKLVLPLSDFVGPPPDDSKKYGSNAKIYKGLNQNCSVDLLPLEKKNNNTVNFQRAGVAAANRVVSATDFMVLKARSGFSGADKVWRSRIFLDGIIIQRQSDGAVFVSHGSSAYTFLATQLEAVNHMGVMWVSLQCKPLVSTGFLCQLTCIWQIMCNAEPQTHEVLFIVIVPLYDLSISKEPCRATMQ